MNELRSVGLDVGTTSTQLIVSRLKVENRASAFAVPEMEIAERQVVYRSPVHFTPLLDEAHVDGGALRKIVEAEYEKAGLTRDTVDTGAIIITGETARKENARTVLHSLSDLAGDFVVATAGPDLESVLSARGAGADRLSERLGIPVLHMDIGGGTSNLALLTEGQIRETGCLNVGGRLVKLDENRRVTYLSPVLEGLTDLRLGEEASPERLEPTVSLLVRALEAAAGLEDASDLPEKLITNRLVAVPPGEIALSFSGGVADCIGNRIPWDRFGDIGPLLGQGIRQSRLCRGKFFLGQETIRATVIGAGCHSAQLSGSTVFTRDVALPLKNLPVARLSEPEQEQPPEALAALVERRVEQAREGENRPVVLSLPGFSAPGFSRIQDMAQTLSRGLGEQIRQGNPVLIALEQDMAKALGQSMALRLPGVPVLCVDRVRLTGESYLDVGSPVGCALPLVVKTLVLGET